MRAVTFYSVWLVSNSVTPFTPLFLSPAGSVEMEAFLPGGIQQFGLEQLLWRVLW